MQTSPDIAKERLNEIASLLATAIKRLNLREESKNREFPLDFTAHPSIHALQELNFNGGGCE